MSAPPTKTASFTLRQADVWFNDTIIPKRTASAGFSVNRFWKSPRAILFGNDEDPDGLCGDAALYVFEEFFRQTGGYTTTDRFHIGLVLWQGSSGLNHIANVMLALTKKLPQKYRWDAKAKDVVGVAGTSQYTKVELMTLHVYDLYFKRPSTSLEMWWRNRDSLLGGTMKLGLPNNIDD